MNTEKIREEIIFEIVHCCPFEGRAKLHHLRQPKWAGWPVLVRWQLERTMYDFKNYFSPLLYTSIEHKYFFSRDMFCLPYFWAKIHSVMPQYIGFYYFQTVRRNLDYFVLHWRFICRKKLCKNLKTLHKGPKSWNNSEMLHGALISLRFGKSLNLCHTYNQVCWTMKSLLIQYVKFFF